MRIFRYNFAKFSKGNVPRPPKNGRAFGTSLEVDFWRHTIVTHTIVVKLGPPLGNFLRTPLSATKYNRGIYVFHWMLVAPQALRSVLPVEDSSSNKKMRTFSRIRSRQSRSETFHTICEGEKQSQLLSTTSPLWFWRQMRLVVHSVKRFCLLCVGERHLLKMTFHHNVKKNLFHISTNIPAFFRYIGWPVDPETNTLPPVMASAISSIVFFDDTFWSSSAAALLVKLGLFSSLRTFKSVTTCSSIFCPLAGSAEMSPVDFTTTGKWSLECFLSWLQLLPLSMFLLLFYVFQNHLDELYTC